MMANFCSAPLPDADVARQLRMVVGAYLEPGPRFADARQGESHLPGRAWIEAVIHMPTELVSDFPPLAVLDPEEVSGSIAYRLSLEQKCPPAEDKLAPPRARTRAGQRESRGSLQNHGLVTLLRRQDFFVPEFNNPQRSIIDTIGYYILCRSNGHGAQEYSVQARNSTTTEIEGQRAYAVDAAMRPVGSKKLTLLTDFLLDQYVQHPAYGLPDDITPASFQTEA